MNKMSSRDVVESMAEKQNWSENFKLVVLCNFIDSLDIDPNNLRIFLQEQADYENQEEDATR